MERVFLRGFLEGYDFIRKPQKLNWPPSQMTYGHQTTNNAPSQTKKNRT